MVSDRVLELDTRRRIYAYIVDQPGRYLRELQRALDMPMGALEYHLGQLERAELVTVLQGENKRYFPARMDHEEKRILSLLRQDALRRIVIYLLEQPDATHKDLLAKTGYPPSTLTFYMGKLVEAGLVERRKEGRERHYVVREPEAAYRILVRYRPTFLDRLVDGFLGSFDAVQLRPDDGAE